MLYPEGQGQFNPHERIQHGQGLVGQSPMPILNGSPPLMARVAALEKRLEEAMQIIAMLQGRVEVLEARVGQ